MAEEGFAFLAFGLFIFILVVAVVVAFVVGFFLIIFLYGTKRSYFIACKVCSTKQYGDKYLEHKFLVNLPQWFVVT